MNNIYKHKSGQSVEVVADSVANGVRLTTMVLNYHRFIHSEFMTHRMFSRNASSSRAIPVAKMLDQVENNPATPIHWGLNKPGMQADEELDKARENDARIIWNDAALEARNHSAHLAHDLKIHKQVSNRLLEPFQFIKVVVTATEWENFFNLRLHPDAQPEIQLLAKLMKLAMDESEPNYLLHGDWHTPFVGDGFCVNGTFVEGLNVNKAQRASVARCARVSYKNHDRSDPDVEKDIALHDVLLNSGHMSPFEHVATPMDIPERERISGLGDGITHQDRDKQLWSGNFRGWVQYRHLLAL